MSNLKTTQKEVLSQNQITAQQWSAQFDPSYVWLRKLCPKAPLEIGKTHRSNYFNGELFNLARQHLPSDVIGSDRISVLSIRVYETPGVFKFFDAHTSLLGYSLKQKNLVLYDASSALQPAWAKVKDKLLRCAALLLNQQADIKQVGIDTTFKLTKAQIKSVKTVTLVMLQPEAVRSPQVIKEIFTPRRIIELDWLNKIDETRTVYVTGAHCKQCTGRFICSELKKAATSQSHKITQNKRGN